MLAAANITLRRSGKTILNDISVAFAPGELGAILGPNGAGKSTLLKIISGSLHPDVGTVSLNGHPLHTYSAAGLSRIRAVLSQEAAVSFDFSVEEVVLLGRIPHLTGWESERDWEACEKALADTGMTHFRHRRFHTLSGGEKQRVHLARVLAQLADADADAPLSPQHQHHHQHPNHHRSAAPQVLGRIGLAGKLGRLWPVRRTRPPCPIPSSTCGVNAEQAKTGTPTAATIPLPPDSPASSDSAPYPSTPNSPAPPARWLLLDEPTSALDLRHQHTMLSMVRDFARQHHFGVVAVLHDLNLAMRYADKVLLLDNGNTAGDGPTRDTLTCERVSTVYGVNARILRETPTTHPFIQIEPAS
jgi:ABC-type hemin transport system ATPase subunit